MPGSGWRCWWTSTTSRSWVSLDQTVSTEELLSTFDVEEIGTEALLFQTGCLTITGKRSCIPYESGGAHTLHRAIEHQSSVHYGMPLRFLNYSNLLYQRRYRDRKNWRKGDTADPVLHVVVYNGDRRWDAPLTLAGLLRAGRRTDRRRWRCATRWSIWWLRGWTRCRARTC